MACAAALWACAGVASAQEVPEAATPGELDTARWRFERSLSLRQTFTTNVRLAGQGMKEAVTELTPQVSLRRGTGPVQGNLDYALTGRLYARNADENTWQHSLAALGRAELVPRWATLEAQARIARQNAGVLSAAPSDSALLGGNTSEVATLQVSPVLQGYLGSWADYRASLNWTGTRTKDSEADSYTNAAYLRLSAPGSAARRLGWTLDLSHQASRFFNGDRTEQYRANAALIYGYSPDLRLSLRAGREHTTGVQVDVVDDNTWGAALRWAPGPLTSVEVVGDRRYFGHSHSVILQHRLPRSVWSFTDTRDVTTDSGAASGALLSVVEVLSSALPAGMPEAQRNALIEQYLQGRGLSRNSLVGGGFLTTSTSLQRRQNLSFGLNGVRSSVLASVYRSRADSVNPLATILPGLAAGAGGRQYGVSLNLSHRLTPLSSVSVDASVAHSESTNTAVATATSTRTVVGTWTRQLAQDAAVSVAARRALSDAPDRVYNESALIANLTKRF